MAGCPHCQQALVVSQVDEFTVRLCAPCRGVFLLHVDLVSILERSWHTVTPEAAERAEFVAPAGWQQEPVLHCPQCNAAMEKYGYMGLAAIQLDRCNACESIWLDAAELENMVLILARDNYRSQKALRREWEDSCDIASIGMVGMVARGGRYSSNVPVEGALVAVQFLLRLLH